MKKKTREAHLSAVYDSSLQRAAHELIAGMTTLGLSYEGGKVVVHEDAVLQRAESSSAMLGTVSSGPVIEVARLMLEQLIETLDKSYPAEQSNT